MEGRPTLSANLSNSLLSVNIRHRVGGLALDVKFDLTTPWTVLFGPSGSGKTTVLRAIAGFIRPDAGRIARTTAILVDRASGVFLPAHKRPIRSAAQTPRLFPHMTVERNILYGSGHNAKLVNAGIAGQVMSLFRINGLANRMPGDLSGGERQRASVARAVVSATAYDGNDKALLLLDEPFSGLDAALRDELLAELREWLAGHNLPVLSVTHDVGEAFQLGAEVIRITDGRVVRQGPVDEALAEERLRLMTRLHG